jgi:hypothetical protein
MEIVLDNRKIGRPNKLKVFGSKKTIGLKQDSHEELEDPKEVIRIRKLKKETGNTMAKRRTNNDLQIIHIKLKIKKHESH